jgi:hypothetical protein
MIMKTLLRFLGIFCVFFGINYCSNDDDAPAPAPAPTPVIVSFNATLNGTSEVPSNSSTATGTATLSYNKTTKIFSLNVTFTGITLTDAHVHVGAVGVSGPPVFPLPNLTSPISFTSRALTAAEEADLLANLYYVNLHTAAYTGGEIRGQLITLNPGGSGGGGGGGGGSY